MAKPRRSTRAAPTPKLEVSSASPELRTVAIGVAISVAAVVYFALFFSIPIHRAVGWVMLVPDELAREWCGGNWNRAAGWDRLPIVVLATLMQLSALGCGFIGLRVLGWPAARVGVRLLDWPIAAAIGLGVHGAATVTAGWLGLLHLRWLFWAALLATIPFCGVAAWNSMAARRRAVSRWRPKGWVYVFAALCSMISVYLILAAMLPPSAFDVREYHLQVPKEWYQQGRVTFMSHNVYGNMPLGSEMAALEAMVLWGGSDGWWWGALTGKLTMGLYTLWCAVLLVAVASRERNVAGGWYAAALLLTLPWMMRVSIAGLNEGCLALFYLAVVASVWRALAALPGSASWQQWWRVAGVVAGFACGAKYPAAVFVLLPLLALLGAVAVGLRRGARLFAWVAVAAGIAGGVWYVKNLALSGNPVYPLAAEWLDGRTRTPERIEQWKRAHQVPADERGRRYSAAQLGESLTRLGWRSQWLAPGLVPLALLGAIRTCRDRRTWLLVGAMAFWIGVWFLATHRIERFMVPTVGVAAWLASLNWLRPWPGHWQWVPALVAAVGVAYGGFACVSRMTGDNRILVALADLRDDLPREEDPGMSRTNPVHVWLNRQAPREDGDAVLLVGDAQPFDLELPVYYNTCFDATWLERWLADTRDATERRRRLRHHRIRYVVVDWDEIARYRATYGYSKAITREWVVEELSRRQRVYLPRRAPTQRDVMVFEVPRD